MNWMPIKHTFCYSFGALNSMLPVRVAALTLLDLEPIVSGYVSLPCECFGGFDFELMIRNRGALDEALTRVGINWTA